MTTTRVSTRTSTCVRDPPLAPPKFTDHINVRGPSTHGTDGLVNDLTLRSARVVTILHATVTSETSVRVRSLTLVVWVTVPTDSP